MSVRLVNPAGFLCLVEWRWPLQRPARMLTVAVVGIAAEETESTLAKNTGLSCRLLLAEGKTSFCRDERALCTASPLDPEHVCC